jgi:ribonuclease HII
MSAVSSGAATLIVAGIDEVGRGCLAGPVYAAAVVLPAGEPLSGLRDSKALSARQREALVPRIEAFAVAWHVGIADVEEIDRLNILQATGVAMARAVAGLGLVPGLCRIDGNWRPPTLHGAIETLVGGDALEPAIMAASILAKVARDAFLTQLHDEHPHYRWSSNKGYGTRDHLAALREHGPCRWHRRSFAPCAAGLFDATGTTAAAPVDPTRPPPAQ